MKIYIAMAELEDGNRLFERAYLTYNEAKDAAEKMINDIQTNTELRMIPIIEDIELVNE